MAEVLKEAGYDIDKFKGQMENIRLTNDYFNKIKLMEFSTFFFAWVGNGCCIIHYEFEYYFRYGEVDKS